MSVYLEKLAEFSGLLRREGLTVGLRETEDACRLLADWDLTDRETVRCAGDRVRQEPGGAGGLPAGL